MVDEKIFGDDCLPRRSPASANLSGLSVVPASPEFLVVDNHEGTIAELVSTGVDLDAIVVG